MLQIFLPHSVVQTGKNTVEFFAEERRKAQRRIINNHRRLRLLAGKLFRFAGITPLREGPL